jgi:hypothetical protein
MVMKKFEQALNDTTNLDSCFVSRTGNVLPEQFSVRVYS